MHIHGFAKLTLLDYPGKIAATIFTGGCNFRCPFCHNAVLVLDPNAQPRLNEDDILKELEGRRGKLEGVCITGGEPTLCKDLPDFIARIRELGFLVKLDSNGTDPDMISDLIGRKLINCIAMDIKSSPEGYSKAAGLKDLSMDNIFRSVELIMESDVDYEFRTTAVDGLHTADDFEKIGIWLNGAKAYYLQQYRDKGDLIAPEGFSAPSRETLESYRQILLPHIPNTQIRGAD